jgi:hypothetical protein
MSQTVNRHFLLRTISLAALLHEATHVQCDAGQNRLGHHAMTKIFKSCRMGILPKLMDGPYCLDKA